MKALNHPLPSLRVIITAGEAAIPSDAMRYAQDQDRAYFNAYGPTETAVCASYYRVQPDDDLRAGVPIGAAVSNTQILLLDPSGNLVAPFAEGEICIAGKGLAKGYLDDLFRTDQKFIEHPRWGRLYKTGDRGRWLDAGKLLFLGRADDQIKVNGQRVELGEITAALANHPQIQNAAVIQDEINGQLLAYVTRRQAIELWPSIAEFYVYDDIVYRSMATDEGRNLRYKKAFSRYLAGKTVLEVGPGPELILSRFALAAGAKKVYAVELLAETYRKANAMIDRLNLGDQITLIHGDAREIELPEQVDYCISEIVGAIGGSEGAAMIINAARRHLRDGTKMLPKRSVTQLVAVELNEAQFNYEFSPIAAHYVEQIFAQNGSPFDLRLCVKHLPDEAMLSTVGILEDLDYTHPMSLTDQHFIELNLTKTGTMNGFMAWLNLFVDDDLCVDIRQQTGSWQPIYWPISTAGIAVSAGDRISGKITRFSENGFNPDFRFQGVIHRQNAEAIAIETELLHRSNVYRGNEFYQKLFGKGIIQRASELDEHQVRHHLANQLPSAWIPQRIITLENLPLTISGKLDKQALPKPRESLEKAAPQNEKQALLVHIWEAVLGRSVGIYDHFFQMGGDSIKAIQISSKLREAGYRLDVRDLFLQPTIAELALSLNSLAIAHFEEVELAPLMPIQQWLLTELQHPEPHHFNQSAIIYASEFNELALQTALNHLFAHHSGLRLQFIQNGEEWQQRIMPISELPLTVIELNNRDELMVQISEIQGSLNWQAPLIKPVLFKLPGESALLLAVHHLIIDGVSWRIVQEDLATAYDQACQDRAIELTPTTDSICRIARQLTTVNYPTDYWKTLLNQPVSHGTRLSTANANFANLVSTELKLDTHKTDQLFNATQTYRNRIDELLLLAFALALREWHQGDATLIELESHGRVHLPEELDASRTVGWLTSAYPFRLSLSEGDLGQQLKSLKEAIRRVPENGLSYGVLRYLQAHQDMASKPLIGFNYLGELTSQLTENWRFDWDVVANVSAQTPLPHEIDFLAFCVDGELRIILSYAATHYAMEEMQKLLADFAQYLIEISRYCLAQEHSELTPSDFSYQGIDLDDLDQILADL